MGLEEKNRGRWLDEYPFERETEGWDPNSPLFVDIGGNVGYYCAKFKDRFPNVPGRIILQDLPGTIAHALQTPGVEVLGHDFFQPQPVKSKRISVVHSLTLKSESLAWCSNTFADAKYYHLGWVLHNWNDEKSRQILEQIKSAMSSESVLLINDMILPETGISSFSASLDLVMLGACASRERTLQEWRNLFGAAGLALKDFRVFHQELSHGLMSVVLPTLHPNQ